MSAVSLNSTSGAAGRVPVGKASGLLCRCAAIPSAGLPR